MRIIEYAKFHYELHMHDRNTALDNLNILHLSTQISVSVCRMLGSKRVFRQTKTAEEEKKLLEDAVPKSARNATKWAYRIFSEWQLARRNKDPRTESISFMFDLEKVQCLDINITSMTAESLCFWSTKFIKGRILGRGISLCNSWLPNTKVTGVAIGIGTNDYSNSTISNSQCTIISNKFISIQRRPLYKSRNVVW